MRFRRIADAEVDRLTAEVEKLEDRTFDLEHSGTAILVRVFRVISELCQELKVKPAELAEILENIDESEDIREIFFECSAIQAARRADILQKQLLTLSRLQTQSLYLHEQLEVAEETLYEYKEELKRREQTPEATDYERLVEE